MLSLSEQRKPEKAKSTKSQKSGIYRHTPTFAAQSFTLTATPEIYKKNQTHKLSRPVLERAKSRRSKATSVTDHSDEDRSSGEYDRNSVKTPTSEREHGNSKKSLRRLSGSGSNRFLAPTPHYALFSSSILNQEVPGTVGRSQTPGLDSFTRGRPDWSEMDESTERGKVLRRANSILSSKSGKSHRSKSHYPELHGLAEGDAAVLAMSRDDESVYKGRGCVPWRLRVNVV
ncbi:hypothetical protein TWF696_000495 [Orbilia brochopaga]|uniref:Uncharacterized protein n=1 Tax=Orbilia brochopaga TaxID=3140254 RepID=A0AAV9VBV7_9PEZI